MSPTLDSYLCESYPRIFVERSKTVFESCMGRGFECGNGWFPLINSLCKMIQQHIDWHNKYCKEDGTEPIPQFVAEQVKEKFGALRIYYQGGDAYCKGVVDMAATMSYRTCEICGNAGVKITGHTTGWISTLCEDCAKKSNREIEYDTEVKQLLENALKEDQKYV